MEKAIEKWSGKVNEVSIGATSQEGGTRSKVIKVGGENTLPFLHFEGKIINPPVVAMEVWDMEPPTWPDILKEEFKDCLADPVGWAKKAVESWGIDLLCLRLFSTHPDAKDTSGDEAADTVEKVLKAVKVPLIVIGGYSAQKDGDVLFKVSEIANGENCLLGIAVQENYKTITAACISGGHSIIAETPIDINLAKQLNILISDMGFPAEKIVIHHSTGGLGYGLEYTYSVMERTRLAALSGDKMLSQPMINFVGQEVWRAKETKTSEEEMPVWGKHKERAVLWEATTAVAFLNAGADILVMNHPQAIKLVKGTIKELMEE
ncbi:MAG: acetyl-CoA decarbonylase/synthase complex subunit delta [Candidatus Omnitrophica bacterium]|nr:acetyl-CoA decarbonylase/synthase complex subunit delta [Candidatus Omnitrophota bacterium]MCM8793885.1 acetyl-CoA decarbonylase/synthase complex subunit delta [Candidatus Omnitrophota bacterium]